MAYLSLFKIDLRWADNQYTYRLFELMRDITNITNPPKREKISASEITNFIR